MSIRREILPSQEVDGDEVDGEEVEVNTGSSSDAQDGEDTSKSGQQMKGKDEVEENKAATERKTVTGEKRPRSTEDEDEEEDETFNEKKKFKNDQGMLIRNLWKFIL